MLNRVQYWEAGLPLPRTGQPFSTVLLRLYSRKNLRRQPEVLIPHPLPPRRRLLMNSGIREVRKADRRRPAVFFLLVQCICRIVRIYNRLRSSSESAGYMCASTHGYLEGGKFDRRRPGEFRRRVARSTSSAIQETAAARGEALRRGCRRSTPRSLRAGGCGWRT